MGAVALHLTLPNINQSRNAIKNHNAANNEHKPTTNTVRPRLDAEKISNQ
jgi:hypothetical protein